MNKCILLYILCMLFSYTSKSSLYASSNVIILSEDVVKTRSIKNFNKQDNQRDKIIEVFNYACHGCYDFQRYMYFWKKNNLLVKEKMINYYLPINLYSEWIPLSKAYYASVRLNIIDKFHNNIFFNYHYSNDYGYKVSSIKKYFIKNDIKDIIFHKTINSFTILKDIKNTNKIKKDIFLSETPAVIIYKYNKIFIITVKEEETSVCPMITKLSHILKII